MSRVLMLTPQVPYPPQQGTALRNWGLLRGIAGEAELSWLSFAAPDQSLAPPSEIAALVARAAIVPQPTRTSAERFRTLLTSAQPDLAWRLRSERFRAILRSWLAEFSFDWVLVEGLELAPYLSAVWELSTPPRVAFDDHNCEYLLQKRAFLTDLRRPARWLGAAYSGVQWRRLRRYEAEICHRADLIVAVSGYDAAALRELVSGRQPLVIPNGITVAEYATYQETLPLKQPAFVFTGTMDFRPNVDGVLWFAREVWPLIRSNLPAARFYIVGRHPHRRLEPLHEEPGIVITGSVPDTRPYIRAATAYVVPLLVGGGTRLKILEASAMGQAIVSTSLGAEGFPTANEALILADEPEAFAIACLELAEHSSLREHWGKRATNFARAYDWDTLLPPLLRRLIS